MFDLDSRGEILWVMVERGLWRQHFLIFFCSNASCSNIL